MQSSGWSRNFYVAPAELNLQSPASDSWVMESQLLCHDIYPLPFFLSEEKNQCGNYNTFFRSMHCSIGIHFHEYPLM